MNQNFIVRDFKPKDFEQVNKVWQHTKMGGAQRGDNLTIVLDTLKNGAKLLVLEDITTNIVIGTSWMTHDFRRIYLHHFGILPDYQGKGLSKLLLKDSLEFAKSKQMQIKLEVHKTSAKAINIYKKAGFSFLGDYDVYIIRDTEKI